MPPADALLRPARLRRREQPLAPRAQHQLRLANGRRMGAAEFGRADGPAVVYLHGFLGSRLEPGAAGPLYVRTIGIDRPAYGWTDPQQRPSLAAFGRDVAEALDLLAVGACVLVGASSGAGYAIAAALAADRRVRRLMLVGGVGPPEVLAVAGGKVGYLLALGGAGSVESRVRRLALRTARLTGNDRNLVRLAVAAEAEALRRVGFDTGLVQQRLLQSLRAGSTWSMAGPVADGRMLSAAWDLDPGALQVPTLVLHGSDDGVVPPAHGRWLAAHCRGAVLRPLAGERHLSSCFASAALVQEVAERIAGGD